MSLKAYKTIFVKPEQASRIVDVNKTTAYAVIFKPLSADLEQIKLLFRLSGSSFVKYSVGIFAVDGVTGKPQLSDLSQLSGAVQLSHVEEQPSSATDRAWLSFKYSLSTLDTDTHYALVVTSNLVEGSTQNANGVFYTNSPASENQNHLFGSWIFTNNDWYPLTNNGIPIAPCMYMYGGEVDETTALDAGTTQTAGNRGARGHELYLTLKNTSPTSTFRNVRLTSVQVPVDELPLGVDEEVYAKETFAAPGKWTRYSSEFLPRSAAEYQNELVYAGIGETLEPLTSVMFVQHDRIYPYPKPYIKIDYTRDYLDVNTTIGGETDLTDRVVAPYNDVVYLNDTNADIQITQNSVYNFKTSVVKNPNGYKNKNNQLLPVKTLSPLVGKHMRKDTASPVQNGFLIKTHNSTDTVTVDSRRVYPAVPNTSDATNTSNAIIQSSSASSIYAKYFSTGVWKDTPIDTFSESKFLELFPYSLSRFNDEESILKDYELAFKRMFALTIENVDQTSEETSNAEALIAEENRLPHLIVSNINNFESGIGNGLQSVGYSIYRAKADEVQSSVIEPEVYDQTALFTSGLADYSAIYGTLPYSGGVKNYGRGLALVQHYASRFNGCEFLPMHLISGINENGIRCYGEIVSCGVFNTVDFVKASGEDAYTLKVNKVAGETANFTYLVSDTSQQDSDDHNLYLCINPMQNTNLDNAYVGNTPANPEDVFLKIRGIYTGVTNSIQINVEGTLDGTGVTANVSDAIASYEDGTNIPYYIVHYKPVTEVDAHIYDNISLQLTKFEVALIFDVSDSCINAPADKIFYNEHNLQQLYDFVDSIPSQYKVMVGIVNGSTNGYNDSRVSDNKTTIKANLQGLWKDVANKTFLDDSGDPIATTDSLVGGTDDYEDGLWVIGSISAYDTNLGNASPHTAIANQYAGIIYLFGDGDIDSLNHSYPLYHIDAAPKMSLQELMYDGRMFVCPIQIFPAVHKKYLVESISGYPELNFTLDYTFFDHLVFINALLKYGVGTLHPSNVLDYEAALAALLGTVEYNVNGWYSFTSNGNLADVLRAELLDMHKLYNINSSLVSRIKDYSIVLPLWRDCEMEPDGARIADGHALANSYFTGTDQLFDSSSSLIEHDTIEQDAITGFTMRHAYEVFEEPYYEWSTQPTKYVAYDKYEAPVMPEYANKDNDQYTIFNFYSESVNNELIANQRCLVISLEELYDRNYAYGYGYGYTLNSNTYGFGYGYEAGSENDFYKAFNVFDRVEPTDSFNRVSFAYKITKPLTSLTSTNANVKLFIETSDTEGFSRESENTQILFEGILNETDPTIVTPTRFTDTVLRVAGHQTPDGFCLFILDLRFVMSKSTAKFLRIYAEKEDTSSAQSLSLGKLRVYHEDENSLNLPCIFGTSDNPEQVITDTGSIFNQNNEYLTIDLGREKQVKKINFTIDYINTGSITSSLDDILTVLYKTFNKDFSESEKIIKKIVLKNAVPADTNTLDVSITCNFYSRLLIFNKSGFSAFKIKNLEIGTASTAKFYNNTTSSNLAIQYEYAYYDENLALAPEARVCKMGAKPNNYLLGIKLAESTPVYVNQVSFCCKPEGAEGTTHFKLQKTEEALSDIDPNDTLVADGGIWEDVAEFDAIAYDRLPTLRISSSNILMDGTVIVIENSALLSRFSNNKLANYILKPNTTEDLIFMVLQSWTDSNKAYIKINADFSALNLTGGMEFIIERPTMVSFPSTTATALQLVQLSGGETQINSLKAYTNIIKVDGTVGTPTVMPTELNWYLQISTQ